MCQRAEDPRYSNTTWRWVWKSVVESESRHVALLPIRDASSLQPCFEAANGWNESYRARLDLA